MRSFHSMIELQSMSMQTIQKQMELTRVPPPPPPPPDYVGLGKTLLEILRDLGMKAMDSGYVRRPLPARRNQELPEIRDAEVSQPVQKAQPTQFDQQAPAAKDDRSEAQQAAEEGGTSQGAEELRRVLHRMGKVDVSRAFSSPENLRDLLTEIRKEIDERRELTAEEKTPASPSVKTLAVACAKTSRTTSIPAPVPSSNTPPATPAQVPPASTQALAQPGKTPLPSSKTPPQSSKAPPPTSGKTSSQSSKRPPPALSQTAIFGQQPWSAGFLEMSTPHNTASVREIAFFLDGPVGTGRLHPPTSAALKLVPRPGTSWSTSGPGAFRDFFVPKTPEAERAPCALRTLLPMR